MKPFLLLFIGGALGALCGAVQSYGFKSERSEAIGASLDPVQEERILSLKDGGADAQESGMLPSSVLPRVEVIGGTDFDFGTMKRGTTRTHEFVFKNTGEAPLKLEVLGSTCKCTVGSVNQNYIEPGEEAPVKLSWHAEGILPDFAQTATIGTTDPRMREVKLTITGRIGQSYILQPDSLALGEFLSRDTVVKTFKLYSYEDTPLKCNGYWGDLDLAETVVVENEVSRVEPGSVPEHADARYVADFTVTVKPGMVAGPINGQVRLVVGPDEFPMSVPTTGRCVSDLRILAGPDYDEETSIFDLGRINGKDGGSKSFYISAVSEQKDITLEVGRVLPESIADDLKITFGKPIVSDRKMLFPCTIAIEPGTEPIDRGGSNPGKYGKIYFRANIENSEEISMYLRFKVE